MRVSIILGALFFTAILTGTGPRADEGVSPSFPDLPDRLVFATADTPPFSTPEGTGLYDRMIRQALEDLGMQLEIRRLPSQRGLIEASTGRVDGEYGRAEAVVDEYPDLMVVPTPLSEYAFVAISRDDGGADTGPPHTFGELAGSRIAYINGWKIFESNVSVYRSLTVVADENQLFTLLATGRVDVVLYDRTRARAWASAHPEVPIHIAETPLAVRTMHLLLNSRHADLVPVIDAALSRVRETEGYRRWYSESFRTAP
jgi:polar amino acid transport system substrate-binding protein